MAISSRTSSSSNVDRARTISLRGQTEVGIEHALRSSRVRSIKSSEEPHRSILFLRVLSTKSEFLIAMGKVRCQTAVLHPVESQVLSNATY